MTFTFTMDAMPGYTYFDKTKKVLLVMQIVHDTASADEKQKSVLPHADGEDDVFVTKGENGAATGGTDSYYVGT